MQMLDWNTYRKQLVAGVGGIAKLSPDTIKGYAQLGQAGAKTGHLDAKTRELIALAVAVSLRCDGCIAAWPDGVLDDGRVEMDTNVVERAIRPYTMCGS